jgi:hypothetical protein
MAPTVWKDVDLGKDSISQYCASVCTEAFLRRTIFSFANIRVPSSRIRRLVLIIHLTSTMYHDVVTFNRHHCREVIISIVTVSFLSESPFPSFNITPTQCSPCPTIMILRKQLLPCGESYYVGHSIDPV